MNLKTTRVNFLVLFVMLFFTLPADAQQRKTPKLNLTGAFLKKQLLDAAKQIKFLESNIKEADIPTTFYNGQYVNWGSGWWCSGFYAGTTLYLYEGTKDKTLLNIGLSKLKYLEKEKNNKTTHDLGFMLYCSFGNALRLTGDSTKYKEILSTGAESLASRFNATTNTIRSWDGGAWSFPVIIDNMMNLEFLSQVSKITRNKRYLDIAVAHANTTLKNHFRKDYSVYHVVDYDKKSGAVIAKKTAQGAFDESIWARGQAWALYGYTMMYRETKDQKYLAQAHHIANFYLNHPNLPSDLIPYWDFDQNKLPAGSKYAPFKDLRDASSAAIVASALLELSTYTKAKESQYYVSKAEKMIQSLSKAPYKAAYKDNGGYILKHSVGSIPHNTEVDVPLTYADYYYVEALIRYNRLLKGKAVIQF